MTPEQHDDVDAALLAYWTSRDEAAVAQAARGVSDVGGRAGATAGGHLDRIAQLFGNLAKKAGAPADRVFYKHPSDDPDKRAGASRGFTLPGYYRPTKEWDLVVWSPRLSEPIVCVELKSQNGPSYGNNANNRAEETIGNAFDLGKARNQGLIPGDPWLGYVYVIEDDLKSRQMTAGRNPGLLEMDPIFADWTYVQRVAVLCHRLVDDGHYDSCWAVTTSRPACADSDPPPTDPSKIRCPHNQPVMKKKIAKGQIKDAEHRHEFGWSEPASDVSGYSQFVDGFTKRIRKHFPQGPGAEPSGQLTLQ